MAWQRDAPWHAQDQGAFEALATIRAWLCRSTGAHLKIRHARHAQARDAQLKVRCSTDKTGRTKCSIILVNSRLLDLETPRMTPKA